MKIVFIGFMGVGKSTLAALVASRLGWTCLELDEMIVTRSQLQSVNEIFQVHGEAYFRKLESEVCQQLNSVDQAVLSTGGGIVENPNNIAALKGKNTRVIWLRCDFEELAQRLQGDSTRPLFLKPAEARARFEKRQKLYENAADYIVDTAGKSPETLVTEILALEGFA